MQPFFVEGNAGVLVGLVFGTILLGLEGLYLLWNARHGQSARKLSRRMQALAEREGPGARVRVLKERTLSKVPGLDRWLAAMPRMQSLQRWLQPSGVRWSVSQLLVGTALLSLVGYLLGTHIAALGALGGVGVGVLLASAPWLHVAIRRSRRLARIEQQLPEALDFISRSLRSGQAFTSALLMAGEELPEPIASEFRIAHDEITFGVSLELALTHMSDRLPVTDLRYFVVSVLIQRDSGGNLTEVLGNLSRLIRERYKLMAKIRIMSADGRFSALILVLAPFALGAMMHLGNPRFMSVLWTDPMGISMIKALLALMLVGVLILRKIVKIRV